MTRRPGTNIKFIPSGIRFNLQYLSILHFFVYYTPKTAEPLKDTHQGKPGLSGGK